MSQTLSYQEAGLVGTGYVTPTLQQPGELALRPHPVMRSPKQPAPTAVPMLDWPSDLFSDNTTLDDLVTVDFVMQCDPGARPTTH